MSSKMQLQWDLKTLKLNKVWLNLRDISCINQSDPSRTIEKIKICNCICMRLTRQARVRETFKDIFTLKYLSCSQLNQNWFTWWCFTQLNYVRASFVLPPLSLNTNSAISKVTSKVRFARLQTYFSISIKSEMNIKTSNIIALRQSSLGCQRNSFSLTAISSSHKKGSRSNV